MSAFILENSHINWLVNALFLEQFKFSKEVIIYNHLNNETITFPDNIAGRNRVGQILVDQNFASVNAHYNERHNPLYQYQWQECQLLKANGYWPDEVIAAVLKASVSYQYQSADIEDYHLSIASLIINEIKENLIRALLHYQLARSWDITSYDWIDIIAKP